MAYMARWLGRHRTIDQAIASMLVVAFERDAYRRNHKGQA